MSSFKSFYNQEVRKKVSSALKITNPMAVPRLVKVVVNVGAGEAVVNKGVIEKVKEQLQLITGQRPVVTKAKKSVSAFKIRQGAPIGVKVTLRGERMYSFVEKLVKIVIPRLKDFRGVRQQSLDKYGNLNIGFPEQTIFPEISFDTIDKIRGLEVTIVTNAYSREKGKALFEALGIPFSQ